jgi:hypothetical protein
MVFFAIGIEKENLSLQIKNDQNIGKCRKERPHQMLVAAYSSNRKDLLVWQDRQWEWAVLTLENGDFRTANCHRCRGT